MRRIILLPLIFILPFVSAGMTVEPYGDGYAVITLEIPVEDYTTSIDLILPEGYADVFVVDENGNPLPYTIEGNLLTVDTVGAGIVSVTYSTPSLLENEGEVWTLNVKAEEPVTVILPEGAVLVALSEAPLEMEGNSITMPPGEVWVSYTLDTSNAEPSQVPTTNPGQTGAKGVCGPAFVGVLALLPPIMRKAL